MSYMNNPFYFDKFTFSPIFGDYRINLKLTFFFIILFISLQSIYFKYRFYCLHRIYNRLLSAINTIGLYYYPDRYTTVFRK